MRTQRRRAYLGSSGEGSWARPLVWPGLWAGLLSGLRSSLEPLVGGSSRQARTPSHSCAALRMARRLFSWQETHRDTGTSSLRLRTQTPPAGHLSVCDSGFQRISLMSKRLPLRQLPAALRDSLWDVPLPASAQNSQAFCGTNWEPLDPLVPYEWSACGSPSSSPPPSEPERQQSADPRPGKDSLHSQGGIVWRQREPEETGGTVPSAQNCPLGPGLSPRSRTVPPVQDCPLGPGLSPLSRAVP